MLSFSFFSYDARRFEHSNWHSLLHTVCLWSQLMFNEMMHHVFII
jgi:hypothetical protein